MSWWDDWGRTALTVVTGGLYGAIQAGVDSQSPEKRAPQEKLINEQTIEQQLAAAYNKISALTKALEATKLHGLDGFAPAGDGQPCCCDRFEFSNGLLLDKMTGRLWEYDTNARALVAIPLKPAQEHEKIASILLEKDLARIAHGYAQEVVSQLPTKLQAAATKQFEQDYLDPLRATVVTTKSTQPVDNPPTG